MQVQKFNDYLTEAKTPEKIRFLIVSDEPEDDKNFHSRHPGRFRFGE